ncbi:hypothetical protein GO755_30765 [Spirosoma sp. HMF4905]|uniref:Uncharacterized protein n=1 Tax=Spirosoma arboris TaxID=2682092 RepID=A0A7K1SL79_9BACT|nr:hypothetical protein [Spirosoma arboris]MVM34453.1 hypothetical protein [Spirosoma arboris]
MIAYSAYKQNKLEFYDKILKQKGKITEDDMRNFKDTLTPQSYRNFRNTANKRLAIITEKMVNEKKENLFNGFHKDLIVTLKNHLVVTNIMANQQKGTLINFENSINTLISDYNMKSNSFNGKQFFIGLAQNIIANLIWLLIVFLIWFSLTANTREDVYKQAQKIFLNKELPDSTKK